MSIAPFSSVTSSKAIQSVASYDWEGQINVVSCHSDFNSWVSIFIGSRFQYLLSICLCLNCFSQCVCAQFSPSWVQGASIGCPGAKVLHGCLGRPQFQAVCREALMGVRVSWQNIHERNSQVCSENTLLPSCSKVDKGDKQDVTCWKIFWALVSRESETRLPGSLDAWSGLKIPIEALILNSKLCTVEANMDYGKTLQVV